LTGRTSALVDTESKRAKTPISRSFEMQVLCGDAPVAERRDVDGERVIIVGFG
jgi:hypothetical protein